MKERAYIAIDLKSFFASVECRERGLDPLDTNLVVADESRTRPSAWPSRLRSRAAGFPAGGGCSRSGSASGRRTRSAGAARRGESWRARRIFSRSCKPIRLWRWISSSRRREWRIIWRTAAASIRFTSNTSRRRISWSIPSTRCSWMRRIT